MRFIWLTDLHFDFLPLYQRAAFLTELAVLEPQAILLGGDISNASRLDADLGAICAALKVPVYAVLGNHDYYGSSIAGVREQIRRLARQNQGLTYLEAAGVIRLSANTALVGYGCWGDGQAGDYVGSGLVLADFSAIDDFKGLHRERRSALLKRLGREAAEHFGRYCREAARDYRQVIVLTHVPPFWENCLHKGRTDPHGLPFFCCRQAGEALAEVAQEFPAVEFTALSGHTHHSARKLVLPNVQSLVQGAEYYRPSYELLEFV